MHRFLFDVSESDPAELRTGRPALPDQLKEEKWWPRLSVSSQSIIAKRKRFIKLYVIDEYFELIWLLIWTDFILWLLMNLVLYWLKWLGVGRIHFHLRSLRHYASAPFIRLEKLNTFPTKKRNSFCKYSNMLTSQWLSMKNTYTSRQASHYAPIQSENLLIVRHITIGQLSPSQMNYIQHR